MNGGMSQALLRLEGMSKSFFGVQVLKQVCLQLRGGQTLGLVGENGAGKSTLMNILGGNVRADAGRMEIDGKPYLPTSARDAEAAGIAFIHQELNLFPNLSIAENLFLARFPTKFGCIDRRKMHDQARHCLEEVGSKLSPHWKVERLSAGERQLVEIAKAIHQKAKWIILDEPTTSLTSRETDTLFSLLVRLQSQGIGMIYISHALGDVQKLCDEVVVLRDGNVVAEGPMNQFSRSKLVSLMVGRDMEQQFPAYESKAQTKTLFQVDSLCKPGVIENISFHLQAGEILGIGGLMGSGRTELARILFGLESAQSGTIRLDNAIITHDSTRQRIMQGMAMLTESRRDDGLCMQASIHDNISLVAASKFASRRIGWIRRKSLNHAVSGIRDATQLTSNADMGTPVQTLSGGNQQKVVLAKWLLMKPKVLILDEPTRGIDVGAKFEIYRLISELAGSGSAILVVSSEMEELMGICDRMVVMSQGEIKDELLRSEFNRERILRAALRQDVSSGTVA